MKGFDLLAPVYDAMENLLAGGKLKQCRQAHLPRLYGRRHALLAGEGHGRFLADLLRSNVDIQITYLDSSAEMLRIARERLTKESLPLHQVTFLHRDILDWEPEHTYDLVVTQFFLDCFPPPQLAQVVTILAKAACPQAWWLVCDFQIPPSGPARWRAQAIHWLMYRFFRTFTKLPAAALTQPAKFLEQQGFTSIERRESEWGLLYSQLWLLRADAVENPATSP